MAGEELEKKLSEIKMSAYNAELYESYLQKVKGEILLLRNILESLEAKQNDQKIWTKHQTSGDLDENKLVEGITGEKTVYKRRSMRYK